MTPAQSSNGDLSPEAAVVPVAASVRRLLAFVPERQAHVLAMTVLEDLRAQGIRLTRDLAACDPAS